MSAVIHWLSVLSLTVMLSGCSSPSSLLFYPMKELMRSPAELGLNYQDLYLTTSDGVQLHAWYLPPASTAEAKGNLLFLHGNAENISTHIASVAWLPEQGYGVLALDYRGFGRSQGVAKLPDIFADIVVASDWLQRETPPPHFLLGQSIGAALSAGFLNDPLSRGFAGVILDAPFTGYQAIARHALNGSWVGRWLLSPAVSLLPNDLDPLDHIGKAIQPLLFFAGNNDQIVPPVFTRRVFDAAPTPKQLSLHEGGHIATFNFPGQRDVLLRFLAKPTVVFNGLNLITISQPSRIRCFSCQLSNAIWTWTDSDLCASCTRKIDQKAFFTPINPSVLPQWCLSTTGG